MINLPEEIPQKDYIVVKKVSGVSIADALRKERAGLVINVYENNDVEK
jgi:hypothetical protein